MLYCINIIHCGLPVGVLSFFLWRYSQNFLWECVLRFADMKFSLPGAIASYGLALGVLQIHGKLPPLVLALITGLNAATVGIIAHAAVYLSHKAITDTLTRMLVVLSAAAGLLYNALWYFPVLMLAGGVATLIWDSGLKRRILKKLARNRDLKNADLEAQTMPISLQEISSVTSQKCDGGEQKEKPDQDMSGQGHTIHKASEKNLNNSLIVQNEVTKRVVPEKVEIEVFSWKCGLFIMIAFFVTFAAIMILRTVLRSRTRSLDLLANLYLAGKRRVPPLNVRILTSLRYNHIRRRTGRYTTIGRVSITGKIQVQSHLTDIRYIVTPGWVSSRHFLLGLAIFQALPGPNFNCRFFGRNNMLSVAS